MKKLRSLKSKESKLWKLIYPAVLLILVMVLTLMTASPVAAAAGSETRNPGTGILYNCWQYPELITSKDGNYAYWQGANGVTSQNLYAKMTFSIQSDDIRGIEVKITKKASASSNDCYIKDAVVHLTVNGLPKGSNGAGPVPQKWGTSWSETTYGGPDYLWNAEWTGYDVCGYSEFGILLSATSFSSTGFVTAFVDEIEATVYYYFNGSVRSQTRSAETGTIDPQWQDPEKITSRDDAGACFCEGTNYTYISPYLCASNFGFSLPSDAIISGIEAKIWKMANRAAQGQNTRDETVRLMKGGEPVGNSRAIGDRWGTSWYETTYGGSNDLWGTTWTPAEINDPGFGLALSVFNNTGNCAYVDYIEITVTYITTTDSTDTDGDGLSDYEEVMIYHTTPLDSDPDHDGLSDYEEVITYHTNSWDADSDDDDLSDYEEVMTYGTNPQNPDTDGDGYSDKEEVIKGTDPLDFSSIPNRPPVANDDFLSTAEDTPAVVNVLANDGDPDGDVLTVASVSNPAHGTAVISGEAVTYTPAADYYGNDSFTYTISDGHQSATASVTVTIAAVNDNPDAVDDESTVAQDSTINCIDVLKNDSCLPDPVETLKITAVTQGENGTVRIPYGGTYLIYAPAAGYTGTDSFTYTISDGNGGSDTATVMVTVGDSSPSVTASVSITHNPGTGTTTGSWENPCNITSVDGSYTHSWFGTSLGYSGSLYATNYNFDIPSEAVITGIEAKIRKRATDYPSDDRYIRDVRVSVMKAENNLANNKAKTDSWSYSWYEATYGGSNDLWAKTWTPAEINDPGFGLVLEVKGISNGKFGINAYVDCIRLTVIYSITRSDTDTDGDGLCDYDEVVFCHTNPHNPDSDGDGYNDKQEVLAGGDPLDSSTLPGKPVANDDFLSTTEDTPVVVDVLANDGDVDGDVLTIASVGNPAHGTAVISGEAIIYTPAANYYGDDSFTYTISDGHQSATASVTVTIAAVNDNPDAVDDESAVAQGSIINCIDVWKNDSYLPDPVETLKITAVTQGANGTVKIPYGGNYLVYAPAAGYTGTDSFTYTISDGNGGSDTATVVVTVGDSPLPVTTTVSIIREPATGTATGWWENPGRIASLDGRYAYCAFGNTLGYSSYLYATNYGFNIPSEAVIVGIEAKIQRRALENVDNRHIWDVRVSVMKAEDNLASNKAKTDSWSSSWYEATYGGSNDLWAKTWTPAEINDQGFGLALSVKGITNSARNDIQAWVDCIWITVTYSITRSGSDTDGDGLCDYDEVVFCYTNPHNPDSDGDGCNDGQEVLAGGDPLDPSGLPEMPIANAQSVTTNEDTAVNITLTGSDPQNDPLTYSVVSTPSHGSLTGSAPNLTYTPTANYNGTDSFTFKVNDGQADSNIATVTITVNAVNDTPTAEAGGPYSVNEGGSVTLSGSGTDADNDPLTYDWDMDDDGTFEISGQTAQFSASGLSGPSSVTVTLKVSDDEGASGTDTAVVTVNNVDPVVNAGPDVTISQGETFASSGSFTDPGADTWTATVDYGDGSGVQPLALTVKTFALNHAYVAAGNYTVTVAVTDSDGGKGNDTVLVTVIDSLPPNTTTSQNPAPNAAGWNKTDVRVNLSATDNASGVKEIHYAINGGMETIVPGALASFQLTGEGDNTLAYFAVDNAGNIETGKTLTIRIDKTPPTLTFGVATPAPNAAGWNNTDVSVPFVASDSLSGVASTNPATSPLVLTGEGSAVTGTVTVVDEAGNSASFTTAPFKIDKTPPVITGSRTPAPNANGWNNTDVTVKFTATDSLSDIASVTPDTTVSAEGQNQSVTGTAVDVAGNTASITVSNINIDKTKPTLSFGPVTPAPNAADWNNSDATMAYTAGDNLSGVDSSSPASPLSFTADGANQTKTVTITDKAGNNETFTSPAVNVDKTKPGITINVPQAKEYLSSETITLNFSASDATSGIVNILATLDGSAVANGQVISLAGMAGNHSLTVSATDNAGNADSLSVTFSVVIAATVDIDPSTLNLKSQGDKNAITAYIELLAGYNVAQIDVATVRLKVNGIEIAAQLTPTSVGDYDKDGIADRMVKFDRQAVISALAGKTGDITLTISGQLSNGHRFTGADTIKVISPGK